MATAAPVEAQKPLWYKGFVGSPSGIRTRVTAVRGRRPRPLDDRAVAPGPRLERGTPGSEPGTLPITPPGNSRERLYYTEPAPSCKRADPRFFRPYVPVWLWQFGQSIRKFSSR
jgi:hypothetical protein